MAPGNLRILLVEDNPGDAELLREGLSMLGEATEIAHVSRMADAERYLAEGHPVDVVLLDLGLPDSLGLATLHRANQAAPHLPIIVLTGMEDEATGLEAVRRGAQDYQVKGQARPRMLLRAAHHAVQRKQLEEATRRAKEEWERTFDSVPDLIAILDNDHGIVRVNRAMAERLRLTPGQCVGLSCYKCVHAASTPPESCPHTLSLKDQREHVAEVHEDGLGGDFLVSTTPLFDGRGHMIGAVHVARDITESKRVERDLRQARIAADAANVAKSQFLANISHELRTPMNAILGMTNLALSEDLPPRVRDYLQTAKESGEVLLELLNQILDFSRIEAGRFDLESAPFSLRKTLDQVVKLLGVRAREKQLNLAYDVPDEVPDHLAGDSLRLLQVLMNLVGNAIKFTSKGEVRVRVELQTGDAESQISDFKSQISDFKSQIPSPSFPNPQSPIPNPSSPSPSPISLRFSVSDTGIGIPHEDRERIFAPFTQVDASTTRNFGGSGLGLTISRSLVELMGGQIWVESRPGEGSTFFFTLQFQGSVSGPAAKPGVAKTLPMTSAPARALSILLVEDTPASQKVVAYLLTKRGHSLKIASNGQQAVRLLSQHDFDVALMDVQMPVMDGFEATAAVRKMKDPKKARLPIIAMTAHALKGDVERCLAAGMNAYLGKPVKAEELVEMVERLASPPVPGG